MKRLFSTFGEYDVDRLVQRYNNFVVFFPVVVAFNNIYEYSYICVRWSTTWLREDGLVVIMVKNCEDI